MNICPLLFALFSLSFFLSWQPTMANQGEEMKEEKLVIGAILDFSSRIGKEEKIGMEIAFQDFQNRTKHRFVLRFQNSEGKPMNAAFAAQHLTETEHVQAILGPRTWEETSMVAETLTYGNSQIPILSFSDLSPLWAVARWPFLINVVPKSYTQAKVVAAILGSWKWRRVIVIVEDLGSISSTIFNLHDDLRKSGVEIAGFVAISSSSAVSEELRRLKTEQCRVFVVHLSMSLASKLFEKAKELSMMEFGYVWITTNTITNHIHSLNSSVVSSMQGVVGIRTHFLETGQDYRNFYLKFRRMFRKNFPEEDNYEPGVFALQAYDAATTLAQSRTMYNQENTQQSHELLQNLRRTDFNGLTGKIQLTRNQLPSPNVFQVINVIGRSYRELGFWSEGHGFSRTIHQTPKYNTSMEILGQVHWPGAPWTTPRGWDLPTSYEPLRILVPYGEVTKRFVRVDYDESTKKYTYSGFSIEVFRAMVERLPYHFPYEFHPYNDTYDSSVEQVYNKKFDAVVSDLAITAKRCNYVQFTLPHTESGLVMVVPVKSKSDDSKAWLFTKPFTTAMWILIALVSVYNGFVVWMIERNHSSELKGSTPHQIGVLIWMTFSTLFSLQGEKLHSNLSRMATMVWLFVALVINQSYTANLTSMLTVQRLKPKIADVDALRNGDFAIGYANKSFVVNYMVDVLRFNRKNLKNFSTLEEYASALRSDEIAAVFVEAPVARIFLKRYCRSFVAVGPTYKVGGYGFAFPKGYPMLPDINKAILKVFESGELQELENSLSNTEKCVDLDSDIETISLSPNSFWVLFVFSVGVSTISLTVYVVFRKWKLLESPLLGHIKIWMLMMIVLEEWENQKRKFFGKVSHVESPSNPPC